MMNNRLIYIFLALCSIMSVHAQEHKWALGFYGDVQIEDPVYPGAFGVQGKFDFASRHSVQAQVYGRNSFVSMGADYLFSFLDNSKSDFNVFLGAGVSEEFYSHNEEGMQPVKVRDRFFVGNGQLGVSYLFAPVNLSLYAGYKVKYNFENEKVAPNHIMFGVRYHLW